jgi:uncharacterized protein
MRYPHRVSLPLAVFGLAAAFALGFLVGRIDPAASAQRGVAYPPMDIRDEAAFVELLSGIPNVRQSTGYSCGAAALQAVLAYWGTREREDRLIERLETTPEHGTHPEDIVRVAREFGLEADIREGLEINDLKVGLSRGATVIVDLQAWRESDDLPWRENWEDGHYMVLLGADEHNLYFEDPSLLGSRGFIPVPEFLERWHDYEGEAPLDASDRKYIRMAIFVRGDKPVPPPILVKVD